MARIVSLTPLALEHDSRGLKIAASIARLGHESVVVEGRRSTGLDRTALPFELRTAEGAETTTGLDELPAEPTLARGHPVRGWSPRAGVRWAGEPPMVLREHRRLYGELTKRSLPPAPLYYLHGYWQHEAVRMACREHGSSFVYDVRDLYWGDGVHNPFRSRLTAMLMERLELRCARDAADMTTVSDGLADRLEDRFGKRPTVIRNCHDSRLDEPVTTGLRERLGLGEDAFVVVAIGNAKFGTAFDEALEAWESLPASFHLAFVGGGFAPYEARVEGRGLNSRVHLLPPVPPAQVAAFIASADVAALLYREADSNFVNALPNRFFHAVAAGLPLIYPPLPEIARLAIRHDLGIEADTEQPSCIASAVRSFAAAPELLARHSAAAVAARPELSWAREEKRLEAVVAAALPLRVRAPA